MTALGFVRPGHRHSLIAIVGSYHSTSEHNRQLSLLVRSSALKTVLASHDARGHPRANRHPASGDHAPRPILERDADKMQFFGFARNTATPANPLIEQNGHAGRTRRHRPAGRHRKGGRATQHSAHLTRCSTTPRHNTRSREAVQGFDRQPPYTASATSTRPFRTIHQTTQNRIKEAGDQIQDALLAESLFGFVAFSLAALTATLVVINTGARNKQLSHQAARDVLTGLLRQAFEALTAYGTLTRAASHPDSHAPAVRRPRSLQAGQRQQPRCGDALLRGLSTVMQRAPRRSMCWRGSAATSSAMLLRYTVAADAERRRRRCAAPSRKVHLSLRRPGCSKSVPVSDWSPFGNAPTSAESLLKHRRCLLLFGQGRRSANRVHPCGRPMGNAVERRNGRDAVGQPTESLRK